MKRTSGTGEPLSRAPTTPRGWPGSNSSRVGTSWFTFFGLAKLYQDGIGFPQSDVAAYKWLAIRTRLLSDGSGTMTSAGTQPQLDDLAKRMTSEQVAEAQRAAGAFLATYQIDSYESWRHVAIMRSLPKEARIERVSRALYHVVRLGYPVARWWWRTGDTIRAKISPPVIPEALMTPRSSGTPACISRTTNSINGWVGKSPAARQEGKRLPRMRTVTRIRVTCQLPVDACCQLSSDRLLVHAIVER